MMVIKRKISSYFISMAEPTIQEIFGPNATQTETQLIISKADLATVGLTPSADNAGEPLFASIIAYSEQSLTETNREANIDQSIVIENQLPGNTTRNNQNYRQFIKSITFEKLDDSTFNPMDYAPDVS